MIEIEREIVCAEKKSCRTDGKKRRREAARVKDWETPVIAGGNDD